MKASHKALIAVIANRAKAAPTSFGDQSGGAVSKTEIEAPTGRHTPFRCFQWRRWTLVTLLLALTMAACDNPVDHDEDEHSEAFGLVLLVGGNEIARVQEAVATGVIAVPLDGTTDAIDVEFLNEEGERIHAEDLDEGYSLKWEIGNGQMVNVVSAQRWAFVVEGRQAGETTITLILDHNGHKDFTAPNIPVRVE